MKTIKEYKEEFLKLANELEKDFGCCVNNIYISHINYDEKCDRCDIEF